MVVAQLAERSLPTQEVRGKNPDIGQKYLPLTVEKTKIKKKEARNNYILNAKIRYSGCFQSRG